ncbi:hypothetical protein L7F22_022128 [Adiantum nelumboides]|nr:hypothetical protein [Adiantum nelumboides]MCO5568429.1 hypothetical protein [Adiantum nelumboides]
MTIKHVVAIPYPAQGHINPMLQLCHQLAPLGFAFTFVNTHHIHRRMRHANSDADNKSNPLDQEGNGGDQEHPNGHVPAVNPYHQDAGDGTKNLQFGTEEAQTDGESTAGSPYGRGHHPSLHVQNGKADDDLVNQHFMVNEVANTISNGDQAKSLQIEPHERQSKGRKDPVRMVFVAGGCAPEVHGYLSTRREPFAAAQNMKEQVEQLISNIMQEQPVAFILTDLLLGWSEATASKFGLPWVCFWGASAATCAALIYFADLAEQGKTVPIADKQAAEVMTLDDIPGLPPTRLNDVHEVWDNTGKIRYEMLKLFHNAQKARFLLLNTFAELEGEVLQALNSKGGYSTVAIGPLLPARYMQCPDKLASKEVDGAQLPQAVCRANLFREDRSCLQWLDKQAACSVLFISFGSISARTSEQLEELAFGVEASGCPFLWVRKPDILAGFTHGYGEGGRRGNGLIVSWAPQLEVLSHPAVGGFVTHCGWNSVMESVAMGVPMLCWADTGERRSNQRFVVHVWKCGMEMVSDDQRRNKQHFDDDGALVGRHEIEQAIRVVMLEEGGARIRARAAQLRHAANKAFGDAFSQINFFAKSM